MILQRGNGCFLRHATPHFMAYFRGISLANMGGGVCRKCFQSKDQGVRGKIQSRGTHKEDQHWPQRGGVFSHHTALVSGRSRLDFRGALQSQHLQGAPLIVRSMPSSSSSTFGPLSSRTMRIKDMFRPHRRTLCLLQEALKEFLQRGNHS